MSIYSMSMLSQSPMALITFLQCHCECNFWGIFQAYTPAGCPNSNGLINTGRQQKGGVAVSVAVAVKAGIPRWHNRPELCINNAIAKQPKSQKLEQAHLEAHTHTRGPWLLWGTVSACCILFWALCNNSCRLATTNYNAIANARRLFISVSACG